MYQTPDPSRHRNLQPAQANTMGISTISRAPSLPSLKEVDDLHIDLAYQPATALQTPPDSLSGSPKCKPEGTCALASFRRSLNKQLNFLFVYRTALGQLLPPLRDR